VARQQLSVLSESDGGFDEIVSRLLMSSKSAAGWMRMLRGSGISDGFELKRAARGPGLVGKWCELSLFEP
jgi:hypothetical protein